MLGVGFADAIEHPHAVTFEGHRLWLDLALHGWRWLLDFSRFSPYLYAVAVTHG